MHVCTKYKYIHTYVHIQLVATQQKITQPKANKNQKYVYIVLYYIVVYICQIQFGIYKKFII